MAFGCFINAVDRNVSYNFDYVKENPGVYRINIRNSSGEFSYSSRFVSFGQGNVIRCYPEDDIDSAKIFDVSEWTDYDFIRVDDEIVIKMNNNGFSSRSEYAN